MNPVRPALAAALLLHFSLEARVIPTTPVTTSEAVPAVQKRTNRHFVLVEQLLVWPWYAKSGCDGCWAPRQRLVVHDTRGLEPPRDVTPGGVPAILHSAAAFEAGDGSLFLFVNGSASPDSATYSGDRNFFSRDGGTTWLPLDTIPFDPLSYNARLGADVGGPLVRSRYSDVWPGSSEAPFFLSTALTVVEEGAGYGEIWAVLPDGNARRLASCRHTFRILGTDRDGRRVLFAGQPDSPQPGGGPLNDGIWSAGLDGTLTLHAPLTTATTGLGGLLDGLITPSGDAYFNAFWDANAVPSRFTARRAGGFATNGTAREVAASTSTDATALFAVPSADFTGAWILTRTDAETILSRHSSATGLAEVWRDPSRPEVQALHAGASGQRLLVQSHRVRPQTSNQFGPDPMLAIWNVGQGAPAAYDELLIGEQDAKGFVHLDVDKAVDGEPFLFDYGAFPNPRFPQTTDGVESWGVVRGSLRQRLVIPAAARTPGLFGATWRTDLVLRNPDPDRVHVLVRLLPNPTLTPPAADASVLIPGSSVVTVSDALGSLFGLGSGAGALLVVPDDSRAIEATSRTYTSAPGGGTYGMSVPALDASAAFVAGTAWSFSAGLLGDGFRTNLVGADLSGQGSTASVTLPPGAGSLASGVRTITSPPSAQSQLTDVAAAVGVTSATAAAALLTAGGPESVAGLIAIDNVTNDPGWLSPDASSLLQVRTIPSIVHLDAYVGPSFRTDLFLYNPSDRAQSIIFAANPWSDGSMYFLPSRVPYPVEKLAIVSLSPRESRAIPDAFAAIFGLGGVARLQFHAVAPVDETGGIRVISRTYSLAPSGGTHGFFLAPLTSHQSAGVGEALEILLPAGGPDFQTNLALVELSSAPGNGTVNVNVEVFDEAGVRRVAFETAIPLAGGIQITDLYYGRGLGGGPRSGWIRVSPSGGLVAAYATVVDNGTGDPLYAPALLAAK